MKSKKIFVLFAPTVLLITSWFVVLLVRESLWVTYESMSWESSLYLASFFLFFLIGSMLGSVIFSTISTAPRPAYSKGSVNRKANWILVCASLAIILLLYKFIVLFGNISFTLSDVTDLRLSRGRDSTEIKGGMVSGILGMALSGFTVLAYIYAKYFSNELSVEKQKQLNIVFILGIFTSFLSGGRWAAAIALIIVFFNSRLQKYCTVNPNLYVNKKRILTIIVKLLILFCILYIFSVIFVDRVMVKGDPWTVLLFVLQNNLLDASIPLGHSSFLREHHMLIPLYFVFSLCQYYVGHAFTQFDVLFSAPYPQHAPYLLQYQGYLHVALLNKFGCNFMSIYQILAEIVNPGVYLTLAGAFFLDFGLWGGGGCIFFLGLIGSRYWVRFLKRRLFFDAYVSLLYLVLIFFSPIVAITSTGIYPSLLTLVFVLKLFVPVRQSNLNLH